MYRDIPKELREVIEPVVREHDFELVDAVLRRGRRPWLLRVIVDRPEGDGRIPIERCAELSREIETHLDAAEAVDGTYCLEVSSPGLDRVLAREKDFANACGSDVRIETTKPLDGRRRFRGRLVGFDDGVVRVSVEGHEFGICFADVAKANTVYHFTRDDFASPVSAR